MKKIIKPMAIILALAIVVSFAFPAYGYEKTVMNGSSQQAESFTQYRTIQCSVGEAVYDDYYNNEEYTYISEKETVATVSSYGEITAVKSGSAKIKVLDGQRLLAVITVEVTDNKGFGIHATSIMAVGASQTVQVVYNDNSRTPMGSFTTSDSSVLTINEKGEAAAKKAGNATVTYKDGEYSKSVKITIMNAPGSISLSETEKIINEGGSFRLTASLPKDTYTAEKFFSSLDSSIATVSQDGYVCGIKEGKTKIFIKTDNGLSAYCTVYVNAKNAISLNAKAARVAMDYSNVTKINYGTSVMGRNLEAYIINGIGNNSKTIFCTFAVHGFEDSYAHDGKLLVAAGNEIIKYYAENPQKLKNFRLVVVPCANPDGTIDGVNNNRENSSAFGRCTAAHVDMNRDFIKDKFKAQESRALKSLMEQYKMEIYIDFHGWLNSVLGDGDLVYSFRSTNDLKKDQTGAYGTTQGYIHGWAYANLGAKAALVEFKSPSSLDASKVAAGIEKSIRNYPEAQQIVKKYDGNLAAPGSCVRDSAEENSLAMSWSSVSGAKGYEVQTYNYGSRSWETVATVFGTESTSVGNLTCGTRNPFRIRAFTYSGNVRTYSKNWSKIFYLYTRPHSVSNVQTVARSDDGTRIKISWNAQLDASGYEVYRSVNGKWYHTATLSGGATNSYVLTNLTPGYNYIYKVRAFAGSTDSTGEFSEEHLTRAAGSRISITGLYCPKAGTLNASWEKGNAHGYLLMWSTDESFSSSNHCYIKGTDSTSKTITGLSGGRYYVKVRSFVYHNNKYVYSGWSSVQGCSVK